MATHTEKNSKRYGLKNPEQLRRLLVHVTNQVLAGTISRETARTIGYLANNILAIFAFQRETEIEQRLARLEAFIDGESDE